MEAKWNFVSTGGGDIDGLNNSTIEHFTGNYNYFLAREIIQNSLDAIDSKAKGPVNIVFKLEHFDKKEFPGYSALLEVYKSAKQLWSHSMQALEFLDAAISCLEQPKIPFLKISDYNTTGLSGLDDDMTGGWFNLVRSTGASAKSLGEGGSFGIGKGAPFAASDLRVVFYATNSKGFTAFQGKGELVSFKADDDTKRGVISYGDGQKAIRRLIDIPERFRRKLQGTDIVVAGYKLTEDWVEDLLKSILRNFWYALHCNDLTVEVEGMHVNSENLSDKLIQYFINEPFKDYVEPTGNPLQYYLAVIQGQELLPSSELPSLGKCKFYFNLVEKPMNYVAMLRKSHMVIYSRTFKFPSNFAGVFICDNIEGNKHLRKMEPPAHDKWDPKRYKGIGDRIIDEITQFIRHGLDTVKETQSFGALEIPELYKHLPLDGDDTSGDGEGSETYTDRPGQDETSKLMNRSEKFDSKVVVNPFRVAIINEEDTGGNDEGEGFDGGESGHGRKKNGGGSGTKKTRKPKDLFCRAFLIGKTNEDLSYKIRLLSSINRKCIVKIIAVGEEGSEAVKLIDVYDDKETKFFFSGNKIQQFQLIKDIPRIFCIKIKSSVKLSLKVLGNDLQ